MEETVEQMQVRHRKEQRDLQSRVTSKKKNATKKTRKGVNDECAELERQLSQRHADELKSLAGGDASEQAAQPGEEGGDEDEDEDEDEDVEGALAAQLQGTAIAPPRAQQQQQTPADSPPQQDQQQQQQPKKRNRQKERLARRAAEQEAAADAAHSEAAHMIDHRGIERAYMAKEFAAHALVEKDIAPDGHCLFSAVADQLAANGIAVVVSSSSSTTDGPAYKAVRQRAADYMEAHGDEYAGFLEEPLAAYAAKIRDTAEWGGQLELAALANAYGVEIRVVQDGRIGVVRPAAEDTREGLKTLWLAYYRHGYSLGEHYNSLRKAA
ncbi:hypothetical protein B0T26DRAFT_638024 [Lasiosphaeria miniovina]|uniref:OTU domain-containing protein n=1 Tax=Lasiosphaeria miniovina TaxID=1954250 RepID=A0AA40B713_9PEZI|nr:uncharacterized protein B0T26DRAFT_638024 [Lasiosphaeria miniovina]KAK0728468.1 hypothetical protein B0T26DRAFT_638024 [Lasiosphaeria miniovina]